MVRASGGTRHPTCDAYFVEEPSARRQAAGHTPKCRACLESTWSLCTTVRCERQQRQQQHARQPQRARHDNPSHAWVTTTTTTTTQPQVLVPYLRARPPFLRGQPIRAAHRPSSTVAEADKGRGRAKIDELDDAVPRQHDVLCRDVVVGHSVSMEVRDGCVDRRTRGKKKKDKR